ncbi:MAG: transcriptional regulator, LysR family, partial [Xanthobacteraceae bacterium]|nr:transcriptional regulator, LysR family [Xanthobacteraceae bacterium]
QLDLLVGADALDEIEGLERWPLLTEPYVLLMPANLPAPARVADIEELTRTVPLVRFSARSKTGMEVERHLRRLRLELPRPLEFDTPYGVTAAVADGAGFAVTTPLCLIEAAVPLDGLACHALPGPGLARHLTLIARRQELGRLPREVAAFCRERLAEQRPVVAALVGEGLAEGFRVEP